MRIRELPPLRHSVEIQTPMNRYFRWSTDESDPSNVPIGLRHSDTMPGGYENLDVTLARRPASDYSDLERLSTIQVRDAGGTVVGEYRLERTPRVSGDQMAISPSAVGWQAALDDNKSASMVYLGRDLDAWGPVGSARKIAVLAASRVTTDSAVNRDSGGAPALRMSLQGPWANGIECDAVYDAGPGNLIAQLGWSRTSESDAASQPSATFEFQGGVMTSDSLAGLTGTGDLHVAINDGETDHVYTAPTAARYGLFLWRFTGANATASEYTSSVMDVYVVGDHGLAITGTGGTAGILASNVVRHAVGTWAPLLQTTSESVAASDFVIPHAAFREPTTASEIIRQVTRFGLQDWAVWADKTFYWYPRGQPVSLLRKAGLARAWRARVGPSGLEETGPQIDRVWESILVQYQDVDGSTRTVGPPGSGADTESSVLKDSDPGNPANELGIVRRDLLSMGVGTAGSAIEVGRRFLEQTRLLDTSGRARIVGHVENDRGALFPFSSMRAGDTITFVDAADTSPRRIVRTDKDYTARACGVDLDAPPEGLSALLERLGVVLVPLGL